MKKGKKLIWTMGLLVVICLLIFVFTKLDLENGLNTNGDEESGQYSILNLETADIKSISYEYGEYALSFLMEDDNWVIEDDTKFPLNQDKVNEFAKYLAKLSSDLKISNVTDLSDYGLDDSKYYVKVNDICFTIGDETKLGGEYYITYDQENVYLIETDIDDYLTIDQNDYLEKETILDSTDFISFKVETADYTKEIYYFEDGDYSYSDQYHYYLKDGDDYIALDNEAVIAYEKLIGNITLGSCVDYDALDNLSDYNLAKPEGTVTINYYETVEDENEESHKEERNLTYEISKKGDNYYIHLKDSDIVYTGTKTVYEAVCSKDFDELLVAEILLIDFEDVNKMIFTISYETYTLTQSNSKWYYNSQEVDVDSITSLLNNIDIAERSEELAVTRSSDLQVLIYRNDKDPIKLVFYKYSGDNSIACFNGEIVATVYRDKIVDIIESVYDVVLNVD